MQVLHVHKFYVLKPNIASTMSLDCSVKTRRHILQAIYNGYDDDSSNISGSVDSRLRFRRQLLTLHACYRYRTFGDTVVVRNPGPASPLSEQLPPPPTLLAPSLISPSQQLSLGQVVTPLSKRLP